MCDIYVDGKQQMRHKEKEMRAKRDKTQYLYMMVGIPGSGKSWYAGHMLPHAVHHSSDAIRQEILGDMNDQRKQGLVFQTLHDRVLGDLRSGYDVVYDATNINGKRRFSFVSGGMNIVAALSPGM